MAGMSRARHVIGYIGAGVVPPIGGVAALADVSLSSSIAGIGSPFSALVVGKAAGSGISATSSDGTVLTASGGTISGTFTALGTPTITITETLAGAPNSPKSTTLAVTVSASAPDTTITTDLSNPDRGLNPLI